MNLPAQEHPLEVVVNQVGNTPSQAGEPYHYFHLNEVKTFCCEKMEETWDGLIRFGAWGIDNQRNPLNQVSLYHAPEFQEFEVNFCPFCGKKITITLRTE